TSDTSRSAEGPPYRTVMFMCRLAVGSRQSGPHLHFGFEHDLVLLVYLFLDQLDELEHVIGPAAGVSDDEVGVLVADLGAADLETFQSRMVDQGARAQPAGILEDAPAVLGAQRLGVPLVHP